jgi:hypothetical protein
VLSAVVVLLAVIGVLPVWPGLIHAVGLPPLGQMTDLRVLFVDATGYPTFLLGLALSFVVRTVVLATMLGPWSWRTVGFAARFHLLALPFSLVGAASLFSGPATLFYLLFWIGASVGIVALALLGALPWAGSTTLRHAVTSSVHSGLRLGTIGAYVVSVMLLGAVADWGGATAQVALVPVSAALTYVTAWVLLDDPGWTWLRAARRGLAGVAAIGVVALVAVVVAGPAGPADPRDEVARRDGSLMLMSGVDSSSGSGAILEIDPLSLGFSCEQAYYFSYAGPGDGQPQEHAQCEIRTGVPYEPDDTFSSTPVLVEHFLGQVRGLPAPVTVATHSQGVWIVWEALAEHGADGVEDVILIGPFADNPVSYPADRAPEHGRVGTDIIEHVIANVARPGGTSAFSHDAPLAVELLGAPEQTEAIYAKPLPEDVGAVAIASTFDLPFQIDTWRLAQVTNACPVPVAHPNLPYADEFIEASNRHLDGEDPASCPWWRTGVGTLFRAFSAPPSPPQR